MFIYTHKLNLLNIFWYNQIVTDSNGITRKAKFTKQGLGVTEIGSTDLSCVTTGSNTTCNITLPSISVSSGYTAVGWSTNSTAEDGTRVGEVVTLEGNPTYYSISYKNAVERVATFKLNGALKQTNVGGSPVASDVDRKCTIDR